jgi:hypothetical protein
MSLMMVPDLPSVVHKATGPVSWVICLQGLLDDCGWQLVMETLDTHDGFRAHLPLSCSYWLQMDSDPLLI